MLFNVSVNNNPAAGYPITSATHENIAIPANAAVQASFDPISHSSGAIVNTGTVTVYFKAIATGEAAPTRENILGMGMPLSPGGSVFVIPENCSLDFYLAAEVAVTCKGLYFSK